MIIYTASNGMKLFETRSDAPSGDFSGGRAEFVIDERKVANAGLIRDIKRLAPFFVPVLGEGGELVGVTDDTETRVAFLAEKAKAEAAEEAETEKSVSPEEVLYAMLGDKPKTREEAIEKSRQFGQAVRMYAESLDEERGADVHMLRGKRGKGGEA